MLARMKDGIYSAVKISLKVCRLFQDRNCIFSLAGENGWPGAPMAVSLL